MQSLGWPHGRPALSCRPPTAGRKVGVVYSCDRSSKQSRSEGAEQGGTQRVRVCRCAFVCGSEPGTLLGTQSSGWPWVGPAKVGRPQTPHPSHAPNQPAQGMLSTTPPQPVLPDSRDRFVLPKGVGCHDGAQQRVPRRGAQCVMGRRGIGKRGHDMRPHREDAEGGSRVFKTTAHTDVAT